MLTCGADLTPEPVQWLWPDWLALGKFPLLAGAPGQGKTTIAMGLAATVTLGGRWPDGSRCAADNVLVWSGEDDYTDTLLPRLIAAGADRNRVFFVGGTSVGDAVRRFGPATDSRRRFPVAGAPYAPPSARPCGCTCTWALVRRCALCCRLVMLCVPPPTRGPRRYAAWLRAELPVRPPRGSLSQRAAGAALGTASLRYEKRSRLRNEYGSYRPFRPVNQRDRWFT